MATLSTTPGGKTSVECCECKHVQRLRNLSGALHRYHWHWCTAQLPLAFLSDVGQGRCKERDRSRSLPTRSKAQGAHIKSTESDAVRKRVAGPQAWRGTRNKTEELIRQRTRPCGLHECHHNCKLQLHGPLCLKHVQERLLVCDVLLLYERQQLACCIWHAGIGMRHIAVQCINEIDAQRLDGLQSIRLQTGSNRYQLF